MDNRLVNGIGERIAAHRKRRGISQVALAGLIGRSESWLSQVERGIRSVDRLSVLLDIARVLRVGVEDLIGRGWHLAPNGAHPPDLLAGLRTAMTTAPPEGTTPDPAFAPLNRGVVAAHRSYQAADYSAAADLLPSVITAADSATASSSPTDPRAAYAARTWAYVAAAKLATKLAAPDVAWVAADRASASAELGDSPTLRAAAAYQVACAQLGADRLEAAEQVALTAVQRLSRRQRTPALVSATGALWLLAAVIAARRIGRSEAMHRLVRAGQLAAQLGDDDNHAWTAFGPTNVRIHHVAVCAELGDAAETVRTATGVDVDQLPEGLQSRRAQIHLSVAWAQVQRRRDPEAVLHLLDAERLAPQLLQHDVLTHEILRDLLRRERRSSTPALRDLAARAGVLSA